MATSQTRKISVRFILTTLLLAGVAAGLVAFKHQAIYDWLRLRGYQAPASIVQLATDDTMTASARRVFYVNHPLIQDKSAFAASCPNGGKEAAVLGCYVPDQRGIFLLQVTDQRLNGIEQVTAAHETLHALYDRLSAGKKQQVNAWLMDYYQHDLTDQTVIDQMNAYKKSEPGDLVNEMHSVFGTEITNLPPELENYYRQYFSDRHKIAGYYSTYEAEFSSRQKQIAADDSKLATMKTEIQSDEADLKTKLATINTQQQTLNSEKAAGNISSYNAGVPAFNSLVNDYNSEVSTVQSLVSDYNSLVAARNAIALEEQQLTQDISTDVTSINQR